MKTQDTHGSLFTYISGFILSVGLTLVAYFAVADQWLSGTGLITFIVSLAVVQLIVQLFFFLHLGSESKPRWNLTIFLFMLLVVVIIVFGSIWVMNHLNYNMATPSDTDAHIIQDEGFKK